MVIDFRVCGGSIQQHPPHPLIHPSTHPHTNTFTYHPSDHLSVDCYLPSLGCCLPGKLPTCLSECLAIHLPALSIPRLPAKLPACLYSCLRPHMFAFPNACLPTVYILAFVLTGMITFSPFAYLPIPAAACLVVR